MKAIIITISLLGFLSFHDSISAQYKAISPSVIITGEYLGESAPLRAIPAMTDAEWQQMAEKAEREEHNPELSTRSYPFAETALPKGPDAVWQREMGASRETRAPLLNFSGYDSPYWPPDANGTIGPNFYMQTINAVFTIYNRAGSRVAGPTNMNKLFTGVAGSSCNDGDPVILYDEQADRWLAAEFSLCGSNDYMLIAVSTTNDPTGTWYKYSFDVADVPDYEKFGIWQDGYYMGTNNSAGSDIYVFERSQMLTGGTAHGVGFDNPLRPTSIDGFMCVPPLDNDGAFAPAGEPGLFIIINDDAIAGGSDQLWIYELDVDWTTPANSTFNRVQQLDVAAFDSNFGNDWTNIKQPATLQELDAIPQVIMNPPQYRNFGTYETILCCHTVDVDNTDHAGIRWYELRRVSSGNWTLRQQGTFAPDEHSRWMGSIMLNGSNEIGLGYSVSSASVYPGIRYCGQSSTAYEAAAGILDVSEEIIQTGANSQTVAERWGDYSAMQIDPVDDETFWFTTEYIGTGGARKTKIANFQIGPVIFTVNFAVINTNPEINTTLNLTDVTFGNPTSWAWSISPETFSYVGGTSASSQNPQVQFTEAGSYTISLTASNGVDTGTVTKTNFIDAFECGLTYMPFTENFSHVYLPHCWESIDHQGNGQVWQFDNPGGRTLNSSTGSSGFAILDSDVYGPGNSQNADIVTPLLDFSAYTSVTLSFQHYFLSYAGSSGTLSYSINGGSSWTVIQTWTITTTNGATVTKNLSAQLAGQSSVKFKWNYTGTYGWYWAIDDISITALPLQWTGASSTDWNNAANWSSGSVPTSSSNVIISPLAANWPLVTGNMTLGINCGNLTLSDTSRMTVMGNLNILAGKTLAFSGNGELSTGGNWTNCGTFTPGTGTVKFTGSSPVTVNTYTTTSNITSYERSAFTKSMTALTGASSGPNGDNKSSNVAINFTFNFNGVDYTQARICSNGWLSMNLTGTTSKTNPDLFTATDPNTTLTPWWDDLFDDATSAVSYKTEGTAPFRVFTAEWYGVKTYIGAGARISFQVKLFESTNVIEFHYGSLESGSHDAGESASIGIEDVTGGSGHFIDGYTGSTTSGNSNLKSESDWPAYNYRFSPPSPALNFYNIIISENSADVDFNVNTNVNGTFNVMPGASFRVNNGKTLTVQGVAVY